MSEIIKTVTAVEAIAVTGGVQEPPIELPFASLGSTKRASI